MSEEDLTKLLVRVDIPDLKSQVMLQSTTIRYQACSAIDSTIYIVV